MSDQQEGGDETDQGYGPMSNGPFPKWAKLGC